MLYTPHCLSICTFPFHKHTLWYMGSLHSYLSYAWNSFLVSFLHVYLFHLYLPSMYLYFIPICKYPLYVIPFLVYLILRILPPVNTPGIYMSYSFYSFSVYTKGPTKPTPLWLLSHPLVAAVTPPSCCCHTPQLLLPQPPPGYFCFPNSKLRKER